MPDELGKLRRSSIISTFGPGALVDFRVCGAPVSVVISGLEEWDLHGGAPGLLNRQKISEPRLEKKLGVRGFRLPPVATQDDENGYLSGIRFPDWLQCPVCGRIGPSKTWAHDPGKAYRHCAPCSNKAPGKTKIYVIPARFVLACKAGHLEDFPWSEWVKHKPDCRNKIKRLFLRSERPGIAGLIIRCENCNRERSLEGIFNLETWKDYPCKGRNTWLGTSVEKCAEHPRVLQRGASNLYFPWVESALSIPPWSDRIQQVLGYMWSNISTIVSEEDRLRFIKLEAEGDLRYALRELNLTPEQLADCVKQRLMLLEKGESLDIRYDEYFQLQTKGPSVAEGTTDFEIRDVKVPEKMKPYFSKIVRVLRLREVRALRGFTRITPPENGNEATGFSPISKANLGWLPAIEVRGEGVFLLMEAAFLKEWEQNPFVMERARRINELYKSEWKLMHPGTNPPMDISPRFLMIHSFAHALIRQLSLECGYSSASLKERLYVSQEKGMAGLLIYTATSDSDGTLGGLQRQGVSRRIERIVTTAIRSVEWCSSDPLCIKGIMAGAGSQSLAACHSCLFVPETSCEFFNRLLDRALLIGLPGDSKVGYFSKLLERE